MLKIIKNENPVFCHVLKIEMTKENLFVLNTELYKTISLSIDRGIPSVRPAVRWSIFSFKAKPLLL